MAPQIADQLPHFSATLPERPCALLWDESFLWGVMAWRALREAGLPFDLIRSAEIGEGGLGRYRMLFVPGGWASNKINALGMKGRDEIRRFISAGGSYLGICGGAGMATEDGLDLLPVRRRPSSERVPSFSGRIRLSCTGHTIWRDAETPVYHAWWPSQFMIPDPNIHVLARYEEPQADAYSSDIRVSDGSVAGWAELERRYGILLDPARLRGEPAVVEGRFGRGKVILSLIHFDTPGDRAGAVVLKNLWEYLSSGGSVREEMGPGSSGGQSDPGPGEAEETAGPAPPQTIIDVLGKIRATVADLIETGARHSLWYRRNPLLLQWRRGIRGLEYSTLDLMVGEIGKRLDPGGFGYPEARPGVPESMEPAGLHAQLEEIRRLLLPFVEKAQRLLDRERSYMQEAQLSPLACDDEEIGRLRRELFGSTMSHGGEFKRLIDAVAGLLYKLIRRS
ncbi:MAG: BPL-N domain-containing protein [Deltaproteobacteria bacterium]|nr:BPL-N domain-containing protein [Deltaproteobacteria bacterium]